MIYTLEVARPNQWAGVKTYKGARITICPWISRNGVVTMGIEPESRRRELEKKTGYPTGTLDPVSPENTTAFLNTYKCQMIDGKLTIDTSEPNGELMYEFLRNHPLVAKDKASLTIKNEYVLTNEDQEAEKINKRNEIKLSALNEISKMTIGQQRKALRLLGQNSISMTDSLVKARLTATVESRPDEFLQKWVNNKQRDVEFMVETAVGLGILTKNKTTYRYGTDILGSSLQEAIDYLSSKENADLYSAIQTEINIKLELKG